MSEHMFGLRTVKIGSRDAATLNQIAKKHGCEFVEAHLVDGYRAWFSCTNRGWIENKRVQDKVERDVNINGLDDELAGYAPYDQHK